MSIQASTNAWLTGPGSTKFYTRTYTPPAPLPTKAVLVTLHGFSEHTGRAAYFHPLFAARGIAVFAFDQRGFGLTAQDTDGNKSKDSAYGKTSLKEQWDDIEWAVGHAKKAFPDVPVFLMGHSMGGGEALGFATRTGDKYKSTLDFLSGIIVTSPLVAQTTPAPKVLIWFLGILGAVAPNMLIPAKVDIRLLSHDPEANSSYLTDPLVKQAGCPKSLHDLIINGQLLLKEGVNHWPKELPLLMVHGTEDTFSSHKASQTFHDNISASKKKIVLVPGGYHELQNEPEGGKETLVDGIIAFIEEHSSTTSAVAGPVVVEEIKVDSIPVEASAPADTIVPAESVAVDS